MRFAPQNSLIIGLETGALAEHLRKGGSDVVTRRAIDEERPLEDGPFDLVVSLLQLDSVNDLPGALWLHRAALSKGGLFFAVLPAAGSLAMLRQVLLAIDPARPAARLHPQIDMRSATGLMERAGFTRQVVDSFTLTAAYPSLERLVSDLRTSGLTNVLADTPPLVTKRGLERARSAFEALKHAQDRTQGRVIERFEMLVLTGWR